MQTVTAWGKIIEMQVKRDCIGVRAQITATVTRCNLI